MTEEQIARADDWPSEAQLEAMRALVSAGVPFCINEVGKIQVEVAALPPAGGDAIEPTMHAYLKGRAEALEEAEQRIKKLIPAFSSMAQPGSYAMGENNGLAVAYKTAIDTIRALARAPEQIGTKEQLDAARKWADRLDRHFNPPGRASSAPDAAQIKLLVDRFLAWPLPKSVRSDPCVTMDYNHSSSPVYPRCGTNLLTAAEAWQMFEYLFNDSQLPAPDAAQREARLREALMRIAQYAGGPCDDPMVAQTMAQYAGDVIAALATEDRQQ